MKILVTGSREFVNIRMVMDALGEFYEIDQDMVVVHGNAPGADSYARLWAFENEVPQYIYPAKWKAHGKSAGPRRNSKMLRDTKPDLVLAFPKEGADNIGTNHMMHIAGEYGVKVIDVPKIIGEGKSVAKEAAGKYEQASSGPPEEGWMESQG